MWCPRARRCGGVSDTCAMRPPAPTCCRVPSMSLTAACAAASMSACRGAGGSSQNVEGTAGHTSETGIIQNHFVLWVHSTNTAKLAVRQQLPQRPALDGSAIHVGHAPYGMPRTLPPGSRPLNALPAWIRALSGMDAAMRAGGPLAMLLLLLLVAALAPLGLPLWGSCATANRPCRWSPRAPRSGCWAPASL